MAFDALFQPVSIGSLTLPNRIIMSSMSTRMAKTGGGMTDRLVEHYCRRARGGAALSVLAVTGKPIKYAGTGEKIDDIEVFHPERMASRILGMGDVLSFIEKAEKALDEKKALEMTRKMRSGFDMNDLLDQFAQLSKMGGMQQLLSMLPGGASLPPEALDEKAFRRSEAMILSMTPAEREKPSIITPPRKKRIAAGSGTSVEEVNRLLRSFEQMNKMFKQMNRKGKRRPGMQLPGGFKGIV